jgi:pyruvate carboxylase
MPGGQFTNLKEQARSLGLEARRHEVAEAYRAANDLFGDIVKVTPSSKVVGDMAPIMVSQGLTAQEAVEADRDIMFPASVVEMLRGDLGKPLDGWPKALQAKPLKGATAITVRPGSLQKDANLIVEHADAEKACGRALERMSSPHT